MDYLLLALTGCFLMIVVVLPLIRLKLRTGTFGIIIRENSTAVEAIVRISSSAMFAGLILLAIVVAVIGLNNLQPFITPKVSMPVGIVLSLIGMLVIVLAQAQMGTSWRIGIDDEPTSLCTRGLYGYVRHPIYLGVSLSLLGAVMVAPIVWSLALVIPGFLLIALQARLEETHMFDQHGDIFLEWAAMTGRIIPGIGFLRDKHQARVALGRA